MSKFDTVNLITVVGGVGGATDKYLNNLFMQIDPTHYMTLLKTTAFSAVIGAVVGGVVSIVLKEIWLTIKKKKREYSK